MEDVFAMVGIVSVCLVAGGVFLNAAAALLRAHHESYYYGLLSQISDTVSDISKNYKSGELMTPESCRKILILLASRRWPNIADIKANDDLKLKNR